MVWQGAVFAGDRVWHLECMRRSTHQKVDTNLLVWLRMGAQQDEADGRGRRKREVGEGKKGQRGNA
jgi:hypothetical protein